jgi:hypothetical protein
MPKKDQIELNNSHKARMAIASEDLPEPDSPVITMSRSRVRLTWTERENYLKIILFQTIIANFDRAMRSGQCATDA